MNLSAIKKNPIVKKAYFSSRKFALGLMYDLSPTLATRCHYYWSLKRPLNLKKPSDFNEKIQWLKLYAHDELVIKCADKYGMYEYVKSCGNTDVLNEVYGVYDSTNQISWDALPEKFALKCTHGCGYNVVTNNKRSLDRDVVFAKLDSFLKVKFGRVSIEPHYDKIKPRIIAEKYIETSAGLLPTDYKI
jgi:hypothetical protein